MGKSSCVFMGPRAKQLAKSYRTPEPFLETTLYRFLASLADSLQAENNKLLLPFLEKSLGMHLSYANFSDTAMKEYYSKLSEIYNKKLHIFTSEAEALAALENPEYIRIFGRQNLSIYRTERGKLILNIAPIINFSTDNIIQQELKKDALVQSLLPIFRHLSKAPHIISEESSIEDLVDTYNISPELAHSVISNRNRKNPFFITDNTIFIYKNNLDTNTKLSDLSSLLVEYLKENSRVISTLNTLKRTNALLSNIENIIYEKEGKVSNEALLNTLLNNPSFLESLLENKEDKAEVKEIQEFLNNAVKELLKLPFVKNKDIFSKNTLLKSTLLDLVNSYNLGKMPEGYSLSSFYHNGSPFTANDTVYYCTYGNTIISTVNVETLENVEKCNDALKKGLQEVTLTLSGKEVTLSLSDILGEHYIPEVKRSLLNTLSTLEGNSKAEEGKLLEAEIRKEMEEIKEKAISDGRIILNSDGTFKHALAPNDNISNLNLEQWLYVRTKAFKEWFGDWEKIAPKNINLTESEIYKQLGVDVSIARRTIYSSDTLFIGGLILNDLPEFTSTIDAHGISKLNQLENLLNLLNNGIDKTRHNGEGLSTAPLGKGSSPNGMGSLTPGGVAYRDGLFIIAAAPNETLNENGISVVFINDMPTTDTQDVEDGIGPGIAQKLKEYLSEHYPSIDFRLYSEAKKYYESNENIKSKIKKDSVSKVVDENGEPLVVIHSNFVNLTVSQLMKNPYRVGPTFELDSREGRYQKGMQYADFQKLDKLRLLILFSNAYVTFIKDYVVITQAKNNLKEDRVYNLTHNYKRYEEAKKLYNAQNKEADTALETKEFRVFNPKNFENNIPKVIRHEDVADYDLEIPSAITYFTTKAREDYSKSFGNVTGAFFLNIKHIFDASKATKEERAKYLKEDSFLTPSVKSLVLKKDGYDGATDFGPKRPEYIVTSPNQIKSATDNIGTFLNETGRIDYSTDSENTSTNNPLTQELISKINQAGIPVVLATEENLREIIRNNKGKTLSLPNGTIYGFTMNGKIYLNENHLNPNTAIHEYTHLWCEAIKASDPKLWDRIKHIILQDSSLLALRANILSDGDYAYLKNNEDALVGEVISRLSGNKNRAKLEALESQLKDKKGIFTRILNAIKHFWKYVGRTFFNTRDINTIEDITNKVLKDLLEGKELSKGEKLKLILGQLMSIEDPVQTKKLLLKIEYNLKLGNKIQKILQKLYPEIELNYTDEGINAKDIKLGIEEYKKLHPEVETLARLMSLKEAKEILKNVNRKSLLFLLSKSDRKLYENRLSRVRDTRIDYETELFITEYTLEDIALFKYLDTILEKKYQNAVFNWYYRGVINPFEDRYKIDAAIELAIKHKLNLKNFESPMQVINHYEEVIDASLKDAWFSLYDSNSEHLSNKIELGDLIIYDVTNSEDTAKFISENIISKFFTKSPWCIFLFNNQKLWVGKQFWKHYNALPRKIAFNKKTGKPVGMFASSNAPTWWDTNDRSYSPELFFSIPLERDFKKFGFERLSEFDLYTKGNAIDGDYYIYSLNPGRNLQEQLTLLSKEHRSGRKLKSITYYVGKIEIVQHYNEYGYLAEYSINNNSKINFTPTSIPYKLTENLIFYAKSPFHPYYAFKQFKKKDLEIPLAFIDSYNDYVLTISRIQSLKHSIQQCNGLIYRILNDFDYHFTAEDLLKWAIDSNSNFIMRIAKELELDTLDNYLSTTKFKSLTQLKGLIKHILLKTYFKRLQVLTKDLRVYTNSLGVKKQRLNGFYTLLVQNKSLEAVRNAFEENGQIDMRGRTEEAIVFDDIDLPFQTNENIVLGVADLNALSVLIDRVNLKQDTLPHEYAHHYISWFRNSDLVQEGIKRFGSEEALVLAIGELVVKQEGEAYTWWQKFIHYITNLFNKDYKILEQLTNSFLTRANLEIVKNTAEAENLLLFLEEWADINSDKNNFNSSQDPIINFMIESNPTTIEYTPEGEERQTFLIVGNKVYNNKWGEVTKNTDRNKIFANLAIKQGRAVVVEYNEEKYVVNDKNAIMSTSGEIVQWGEENGDRKKILALAQEKFNKKNNNTTSETKINIYAGTGENADLSNFAIRPFDFDEDVNFERLDSFMTSVEENNPLYGALDMLAGESFSSVEAAFQYAKFGVLKREMGPWTTEEKSLQETIKKAKGSQAKTLGKQIKDLDTKAWDIISSQVMKFLIKESFIQNPQALQRLLATGNATLTATQDTSKWGTEFPKLLMEVREELRDSQNISQQASSTAYMQVSPASYKEISLSEVGYKKGDPQKNPDTAYIFTENAQANAAALGLDDSWIGEDYQKGEEVKTGVSDVNGTNQAGIRASSTNTYGNTNITPNAFGIIVKKYQQKKSIKGFLTKEGQFQDTDSDFELFKTLNLQMFDRLKQSGLKKIRFPKQMGMGKAALPLRFAEWLQTQLKEIFGIESSIEENTKSDYDGYGINLINIKINKSSITSTIKESVIESSNLNEEELKLLKTLEGLITWTTEEAKPCASRGLVADYPSTEWKVVKDFNGYPKHSAGGVDIEITKGGVFMISTEGKRKLCQDGLFIPNSRYKSMIKAKLIVNNYDLK